MAPVAENIGDGTKPLNLQGNPVQVNGVPLNGAYVPTAGATIWYPAQVFGIAQGTPTLTAVAGGRSLGWILDAASEERVVNFASPLPSWWATFHADLYWANDGAGAGDVRWDTATKFVGTGETINAAPSGALVTATAGAEDFLVVTRVLTSTAVTAGIAFSVRVSRVAADVADTLANDVAVMGVLLTRAT